jgi:16S rRNA (cytidine1402-2'-O)-methyltransferase
MAGIIYMVPVTLGDPDFRKVIPEPVLGITRELRYFIAEDIRSARRYLRLIDREFPVDQTSFMELNEHTGEKDISDYLVPALEGHDIGVISEAGMPGIADPGARIVAIAHSRNLRVVPLTGPSSILLALIASGLNGQSFTFNGYLPVKPAERVARIRELEKRAREGYAQIFMETPYRNNKLLESLLSVCHPDTRLCIAADITLPGEFIKTRKISGWKKELPSLDDRMAVFVLQ